MLDALDKLALLHSWAVDQWDMTALNPNRQKFLARLGRKYTVQALRRMGPERRYPILLAVLKETLIDLTDESIDIFAQFVRICRWLQLIHKDRLVLL